MSHQNGRRFATRLDPTRTRHPICLERIGRDALKRAALTCENGVAKHLETIEARKSEN
jgi:hypothetical protein